MRVLDGGESNSTVKCAAGRSGAASMNAVVDRLSIGWHLATWMWSGAA